MCLFVCLARYKLNKAVHTDPIYPEEFNSKEVPDSIRKKKKKAQVFLDEEGDGSEFCPLLDKA